MMRPPHPCAIILMAANLCLCVRTMIAGCMEKDWLVAQKMPLEVDVEGSLPSVDVIWAFSSVGRHWYLKKSIH